MHGDPGYGGAAVTAGVYMLPILFLHNHVCPSADMADAPLYLGTGLGPKDISV